MNDILSMLMGLVARAPETTRAFDPGPELVKHTEEQLHPSVDEFADELVALATKYGLSGGIASFSYNYQCHEDCSRPHAGTVHVTLNGENETICTPMYQDHNLFLNNTMDPRIKTWLEGRAQAKRIEVQSEVDNAAEWMKTNTEFDHDDIEFYLNASMDMALAINPIAQDSPEYARLNTIANLPGFQEAVNSWQATLDAPAANVEDSPLAAAGLDIS